MSDDPQPTATDDPQDAGWSPLRLALFLVIFIGVMAALPGSGSVWDPGLVEVGGVVLGVLLFGTLFQIIKPHRSQWK